MDHDNITPIRKQYLEIKRQHPDTILFFRLGDFYETFDKDAEITSTVLDIVLTSRNVAKGQRVPMAGIPFHAADNYIGKLIDQGYHVAICEQVGEQPKKGLFPRQVVRIITPGTVIEPGLLKDGNNNYLLALLKGDLNAGIAYVDITTGEFFATEIETGNGDINQLIRAEISKLSPAEVLLPESQKKLVSIQAHTTVRPDWQFESERCIGLLQEHFKVASLDGFGLRQKPHAIRVAGAILQYLQETEASTLQLFQQITTYNLEDYMILDASTRRNLELTETIRQSSEQGSLLSVIDNTVSPMGKRIIRQWLQKPLIDNIAIQKRYDVVDFFVQHGLIRAEIKTHLRHIADLERLINRIITKHAIPRDLGALRDSLGVLPKIQIILDQYSDFPSEIKNSFHVCDEQHMLLSRSINDDPPATLQNTGVIRSGYSNELDQVISNVKDARDWISNLESVERQRTDIKTLKVGYNKIFGYYLEVTHANKDLIPSDYIRKQTLVNAERYITPEMKEYEALVLNAEEQIHAIEIRLFDEICSELAKTAEIILSTAKCLAELDVFCSFAETAINNKYCRPELVSDLSLEIIEGRHPVVERTQLNQLFIPNDACFEEGETLRIITGPNMSGKSTFLRQIALIVLMAQIGCFVPASKAKIGIVDRIFTRIGAQDEIFAGQSTFMVEMVETANILHNATMRSLLILDEIGRGTSTYDGLAIAWAVVEYIHNHPKLRARTIFATHYHELTQLSELLPHVRNYNLAVSEVENQVIFLHKIIPGGTDKSYGIHVAQLAGIPKSVIQRAFEILVQLEAKSNKIQFNETNLPEQMRLFPQTNPLLQDLKGLDLNILTPLEALNKLYEWKKKYLE